MRRQETAGLSRERGQSLVEAAIVVPLLLLLLAGVVELGRAFYTYIVITNAAREGARYASLYPHYCLGIEDAAFREAEEGQVDLDGCSISITTPLDPADEPCGGGVAPAGEPIMVEIECPYQTIVGNLLGLGDPFELTLRNQATMVVFGLD